MLHFATVDMLLIECLYIIQHVSLLPHSVHRVVPEDTISSFIAEHYDSFLAATTLKMRLESADQSRVAE